ncbi:MAG: ATPase domain-containing protein [Candidatus Altiarchaeota archaeon]
MERVKTAIPGVDEMIGGGFLEDSVVIVSGSPGIGKSNFAMQYLVNGAEKFNESGVYITVEDTPENIRLYGKQFGWDIEKLEKENKLAIVAQPIYSEEKGKGKDAQKRETLASAIKRVGAKRVVLDSVTLFKYLFQDEISRRVNLLNFIKQVKDADCTTLLVAEQHESSFDITYLDEHFLADGLILLFWSRHRDKHERCFRVVKMRGTKISSDIRPMKITDNGIIVYPTQVPLSLSDE